MEQFNDRKKRVLQAIKAYIDKRSDTSEKKFVQLSYMVQETLNGFGK